MPLYAKKYEPREFELPDEGWYEGECVKVEDLGVPDWAEDKEKIRITFELEDLDSEGRPFRASHTYTNSLHELARLRKDLEEWLGRPLTLPELNGQLDLEGFIGERARVKVYQRVTLRGTKFSDYKALKPAEEEADSDGLPF